MVLYFLLQVDVIGYFTGLDFLAQLFCIATVGFVGLLILKTIADGWNGIAMAINNNDQNNAERHEQARKDGSRRQALNLQTNDLTKAIIDELKQLRKDVAHNKQLLERQASPSVEDYNRIQLQLESIQTSLERLIQDKQD